MDRKAWQAMLTGLTLLAPSTGSTTPLPQRGVFVYSDLCTEPESGDWGGHRLVVVLLDGDTSINYEWGGEGPLFGAAAVTSRFDHPSEVLQFKVQPDDGKTQTIHGTISRETFVLTQGLDWEGGGSIAIPRQYDLNAKVPACKPLPRK